MCNVENVSGCAQEIAIAKIFCEISHGIVGVGGTALNFVGALAIAGTISMIILQVIKELTPVRRCYQRYWIKSWFETRAKYFRIDEDKIEHKNQKDNIHLPEDAVGVARSTLVVLATGGEANAFYDLGIEQLVAQMNAAAQIALDDPKVNFSLLAILSQGVGIEDLIKIKSGRGQNSDFLDSRNRVGHRIQRNLDGIQIALGSRWRWWMQVVSILFTILFVELAMWNIIKGGTDILLEKYLVGFALGLVGGYLGPLTRDIVAAVEKLRKQG